MNLKKYLAKLPIINRIKLVKDMVLAKLDVLDQKSSNLIGKVAHLSANDASLFEIVETLSANDTSLLEATTYTVESLTSQSKDIKSLQQDVEIAIQHLGTFDYSSLKQTVESLSYEIKSLSKETIKYKTGLTNLSESFQNYTQQADAATNNSSDQALEEYQALQTALDVLRHDVSTLSNDVSILSQAYENTQPKIIKLSDDDPETRLMAYLYSFMPSRKAIDIGANVGDISEILLNVGYEIYAFEPFPETYEKLQNRLIHYRNFHSYSYALGAMDEVKELYIAQDKTEDHIYRDSSLYNSLTKHSFPDDIEFVDSVSVEVRSLESLHQSNEVPEDIGLVKIDTEGFDLEVLRGMGERRYSVVVAEFWHEKFPFGVSGAFNELESMVNEMRAKGYAWYLVIYRVWGNHNISFYCNCPKSVDKSWGNVFFFSAHDIFLKAFDWCSATLQPTYIV